MEAEEQRRQMSPEGEGENEAFLSLPCGIIHALVGEAKSTWDAGLAAAAKTSHHSMAPLA